MSLPPFSELAKCPKCGHGNVQTTYIAARPWFKVHHFDSDREESEHLRRTCLQCRHAWNEAVAKETTE